MAVAGQLRTYHVTVMASTTTAIAIFEQFRKEIDDYNDTRERLIKVFDYRRNFYRA